MDRPLRGGVENVYLATIMRRGARLLLKICFCQQNLIKRHPAVGWRLARQQTIV